MLNYYSKTRADLEHTLKELGDIAVSENSKIKAQLIYDKLKADIFSLVVVGQFKRGKTTFINALLGKDFLPTAIIPLTSIITILKYGEKLKITVFFGNNSQKDISVDELQLYVTEKHNPKNEKGVDRVEIFYPSDYLKNGVQVIDTPGVASVHEHNTKTTYEYLPKADAAIFLVSVDPPITQAELNFLRDIKNNVAKVFFVLNKTDIASDVEQEESLAFTKKIIEEQAGFKDVSIYPLSAKTKSGVSDFEKSLEQFLINEKGNVLLRSAHGKTESILSEETFLAELEKKSLNLPIKDLENKIEKFKSFISDISQEKLDSERLLQEEIRVLGIDVLDEDIEKLKQEKTQWLQKALEEFAKNHNKDGNRKFAELVDEFISTNVKDIFENWRVQEENILKNHIKNILGRFVKKINTIIEQIVSSSTEIFGISKKEFSIQETLPAEIEFRFQTNDGDDLLGMTIGFAKKSLPKTLAHKLIIKEAREKIEMLIDRHCGKSRYDFSQRMEKLVRDYKLTVGDTVESVKSDMLKALETGLASKQKTSDEIAVQEEKLNNRLANLKKINELMQRIGSSILAQ
jgi:GTPase SAR1 family protein